MTDFPPLPETDADKSDSWYYTVDQMVAIRREAYIAALEEAAELVLLYWGRSFAETVEGIRALKEKIE